MKATTKVKLKLAWDKCMAEDRSTEYAIQYMQDTTHVGLDCVMNFLYETRDEMMEDKC
jgi:hypothetical protein